MVHVFEEMTSSWVLSEKKPPLEVPFDKSVNKGDFLKTINL